MPKNEAEALKKSKDNQSSSLGTTKKRDSSFFEYNPCSFIKLNIKSNSTTSPDSSGTAKDDSAVAGKTIDWPNSVVIMSPLNLEVLQDNAKNRERRGSERYKLPQSMDQGISIKKFLTIKEEDHDAKETPR